ncbi:hypothetical protein EDD22DRAFT_780076 [Suillus occidentalis]|nr:hypothetical protein EDD22DRAFT_780076 [Suillus occidentalis]
MHLASLNLPDLLIPLWRGRFDCDVDDDVSTWDWAVLQGDIWKEHGKAVATATPFLPTSFDRPPHNPAEKINSGYKAWEFTLYLFSLGPALFYGILPDKYWRNFCLLVHGIRLVSQHSISRKELHTAHMSLIGFMKGFEELYYQCHIDRIHMVRQSIHAIGHYGWEVETKGPLICTSQWTMEHTIGNLTEELRQHSNPYANLSQHAIRRARINALKALIPDIDPDDSKPILPQWSKDIGDGYGLLKAQDRSRYKTRDYEGPAIREYIESQCVDSLVLGLFRVDGSIQISRWARLRIPNGQVARSRWKEGHQTNARRSRNVKFMHNGEIHFGEVLYFFQCEVHQDEESTLALISTYSAPDPALLEASHHTVVSCSHLGDASLQVIDVKSIHAVVAMVPHNVNNEERFFVVEKPGLDVADLGGYEEEVQEDE